MCGICGTVHPGHRPPDRALLDAMIGVLRHRGPDGEGRLVAPGVSLGMSRLAIVDPESGDQPVASEDGSVHLVCNGEIYNAPELRRELRARGHRFAGGSDVEVAVHLWEEDGPGFLHHLRGMFALALWDARERRLLLARDRLGIKPLYWAPLPGGGLAFGSEAKAVLLHAAVDRGLDPRGLADTLTFGGPLLDRTLFRGVRQLGPGEWLLWEEGDVRIRRWWDLDPGRRPSGLPATDAEWVEAVEARLRETVRIHLRGDVPVCCWLSPGVDSSAVASLAAREVEGPLPTFSLGFRQADHDELRGQRLLDEYPEYGLRGERIDFPEPTAELLAEGIWHKEQPLAAQTSYHVLSRVTAPRYKVALTGQGADEVFGGYGWYRRDRRWRWLYGLPAPVRRGIALGLRGRWSRTDRLAVRLPPTMDARRFAGLMGAGRTDLRALLAPDLARAVEEAEAGGVGLDLPDDLPRWDRFHQLQYVEFRTRLPSYINRGLDKGAMSGSVEPRLPFLDHELVELCIHAPDHLRMPAGREKHLLRRAVDRHLPAEIAWRRKRGLTAPSLETPVAGAGTSGLEAALLDPAALRATGYLDPHRVAEAVRRHREGRGGGMAVAGALGLQLWHRLFVEGVGRPVRSPAGAGAT